MRDIKELVVKKINIFPVDYIPYAHLMRQDFIEHMIDRYKFQKHEMPFGFHMKETPSLLVFYSGEYDFEDKKIIINKLVFENRKIVLEARASSQVSKKIFGAIAKDIKKFDPIKAFKMSDAYYQSEETSCIVSLDIEYMSIYSEELISFLHNGFLPLLKHKYLDMRPKHMSFEVDFEPDVKLAQEKVTLASKTLTIEPRMGQSLKKKVFYTESPFDSDTHLKLLEKFERIF